MFLHVLAYPSYTEIQHIMSYIDIETTCLKKLFVSLEMIKKHKVKDIVRLWYVVVQHFLCCRR